MGVRICVAGVFLLIACDGGQRCENVGYVINGCATASVLCTDGTSFDNISSVGNPNCGLDNAHTPLWSISKSAPTVCSLVATCVDGGKESLLLEWAKNVGEDCVHQVEVADASYGTFVVCGDTSDAGAAD